MELATFSPIILIGGSGMILVAVGFVIYAATKKLGWAYLGLGALAWIATVVVKFVWALGLNARVSTALKVMLPGALGDGLFDLYLGLLTGFTEVAIVWLFLRYTRFGNVAGKRALGFGIGFGVVEALLLGASSFVSALVILFSPQTVPSEVLAQYRMADNLLVQIAPIVERFFTVWIHIFCNVAIFFSIAQSRVRWFWIAFWFKSLIDAVAAFAQTSGVLATVQGIWSIEVIVILFGVVGWLGVRWLAPRFAEPVASSEKSVHEFATTAVLAVVIAGMTIGAILGFTALQGNALTGSEREAVLAYSEPLTDNLMQAINRNDYAAFSRDLNERMKSAINADGFTNMRVKVNGKIGNYVSRQIDSITVTGDFITVIYSVKFENEEQVTVRISFDKAEPHRISGLWFDSAKLRQP